MECRANHFQLLIYQSDVDKSFVYCNLQKNSVTYKPYKLLKCSTILTVIGNNVYLKIALKWAHFIKNGIYIYTDTCRDMKIN